MIALILIGLVVGFIWLGRIEEKREPDVIGGISVRYGTKNYDPS